MPRASFHDYTRRCIYHITLTKAQGAPEFGHLAGELPRVFVALSALGTVLEKTIRSLGELSPSLKLLQYCVMPDHIHMLIFVTDRLERHLGKYIGMLKVRVGQNYRLAGGCDREIFDKDFYDCILHRHRSLDVIYNYIKQNPQRLAIRRARPDFFRRVNSVVIDGVSCNAYGNMHLLGNPFKSQVVVHRRDTEEERTRKRAEWSHIAANGGVLVSPFISAAEKAVRRDAEALDSKIILVTNTALGPRFKPCGGDFALCASGRMLIISPVNGGGDLTRERCLALNALARRICLSDGSLLPDYISVPSND